MAIFKCLASGNTVEFTQEYDIVAMRQHPQYEEVLETPKPVATPKVTVKE